MPSMNQKNRRLIAWRRKCKNKMGNFSAVWLASKGCLVRWMLCKISRNFSGKKKVITDIYKRRSNWFIVVLHKINKRKRWVIWIGVLFVTRRFTQILYVKTDCCPPCNRISISALTTFPWYQHRDHCTVRPNASNTTLSTTIRCLVTSLKNLKTF